MTEKATTRSGRLQRVDRAIIWVVFWLAVAGVFASVIGGAGSIINDFTRGQVEVVLSAGGGLPPEADAGSATLEYGFYETATAVVSALSTGSMVVVALGRVAFALAGIAFSLALAVLAWSALKPAPFGRGLSRTLLYGGGAVLLFGIVGTGLHVFGSFMIAEQLNAPGSGADGFWPMSAAGQAMSIMPGIVLLLIGLIAGHGERMQRDTAGLV